MGYAFISYSSQNKKDADAVRELFLQRGVECWMAPYSIPPGEKYAGAITRGIRECACLLLLLTDAAQQSEAVDKEVERAIHYRKSILALQLESLQLTDSFEYYLSNSQIVFPNALDEADTDFRDVLRVVAGLCGTALVATPATKQEVERPKSKEAPATVSAGQPESFEDALPEDGRRLYELASGYRYGLNCKEDPARALLCYQKAVAAEYAPAFCALGKIYAHGSMGVEKDDRKAIEYYQKGCALGDPDCMQELGSCYLYGHQGVEEHEALGMMYLLMAEERGCQASVLDIAGCYEDGYAVPCPVPERALYWYARAKEKEYDVETELLKLQEELMPRALNKAKTEALLTKAMDLMEGDEDTPAIRAEAEKYLTEAAELGCVKAYGALGLLCAARYADGDDHEADLYEGINWFEQGVEAGDAVSASFLGHAFLNGTGVEEDPESAVSCLLMAAEMGDADAQYELGRCCDEGIGLPEPNGMLAEYWYKKADAQGNTDAWLALHTRK